MSPPTRKNYDFLIGHMKSRESRVESLESRVKNPESRANNLDYEALKISVEEADRKPKLGIYSPLAAAMLRYKAITTPRYSIGSEIRALIEEALKIAYPQLYKEVQKMMEG